MMHVIKPIVFTFFLIFQFITNSLATLPIKEVIKGTIYEVESRAAGMPSKDLLTVFCVEGYKFLQMDGPNGMIQFFKEKDGVSVPAKCD